MTVFLDTSVLIAAFLSPEGGSAKILELCEAGLIKVFISKDVIREIEEVSTRKFPELKEHFRELLQVAKIKVLQKIKPSTLKLARKWISHQADAKILAAAKQIPQVILVTLDIRHFIKDINVRKKSGIKIVTPADFLQNFVRSLYS